VARAGDGCWHDGRVLIALELIREAGKRIADAAVRTPLVRLDAPESPAEIWLKLECLQPIGSFKIRGATNAVRSAPRAAIAHGVVTASAGNMGQGVAWAAREAGVPARVVVPDHAPQAKVEAIRRLGGEIVSVPVERWFQAIEESRFDELEGWFVHPVQDELVMAGNGTIGLELLDDLDGIDAVLVPLGGGGLVSGIASAVKSLSLRTKIYSVEPETAAPLAASLRAGEPREVDYRPSFVDGAGSRGVLPRMWPLLRELVDGALVVSLEQTAAAVRVLAERARVIAEGAGALPVAAALAGLAGSGRLACVVSGGNIDSGVLARILSGGTP
jgi:threonine dehydratase